MLIAVTGRIINGNGGEVAGKKVVFTPFPNVYDQNNQIIDRPLKVTTDGEGRFILPIWANPEPYNLSRFLVKLPDGSPEFPILVPPYDRPKLVELSYLRGLGRLDPCEEIPPYVPGEGNGIIEDALDKTINESIISYNNAVVAPNYVRQREADIVYLKSNEANKTFIKNDEADEKFATNTKVTELEDKIDAIEVPPGADLSNYYTKNATDLKFATRLSLRDYATNQRVDEIVAGGTVVLENYATNTRVDGLEEKVDAIVIPPETDLSEYYTKTESNTKFATIVSLDSAIADVGESLGSYATNAKVDELEEKVDAIEIPPEVDLTGYLTETDAETIYLPKAIAEVDYLRKEDSEDFITEEEGDDRYFRKTEEGLDIPDSRLKIVHLDTDIYVLKDEDHNSLFMVQGNVTISILEPISPGSCFLFVWTRDNVSLTFDSADDFIPNRRNLNAFEGDQVALIRSENAANNPTPIWVISGGIVFPQQPQI